MKNKIYILFIFTILVSCNKTSTMEEILIAKPDEYWAYYSPYSSKFEYYKFGKDKISERYEIDGKNKFYKLRRYYGHRKHKSSAKSFGIVSRKEN